MEITVALGGGGAKGVAHIGVLQCLEESGYVIRAIAGTSIGGMIAAIYAAGFHPAEMLERFNDLDFKNLYTRRSGDGPGLLGVAGIYDILSGLIGDKEFSELPVPLAVTATYMNTGREVILKSGRVLEATLATIAIPGVFPPKEFGEYILADGGLVDPVPVEVARAFAPYLPVVAVALSRPNAEEIHFMEPLSYFESQPLLHNLARMRVAQAFNIFVKSFDITSRRLTEYKLQLDQPEVIIRPPVDEIGLLESVNIPELAARGYQETLKVLPELKEALSFSSRMGRIWRRRGSKSLDEQTSR